MPTIELPPVTDAHRRQAFATQRWPGITYEQAMAVDIRRKIIEVCAHVLRTRQARKAAAQQPYPRERWNADTLFGPRPGQRTTALPEFDRKRAAAGDFDD